MKHRSVRLYLFDALEACDRIIRFTSGRSFEDYTSDEMLRSAVERQLMIMGEALVRARAIDATVEERLPDLAHIIGLRNRLVHRYEEINPRVVWGIVQTELPVARRTLSEF